jgi:OmpA-OmpF porin, OOP family
MKKILTLMGFIVPFFAFSQNWELGISVQAANYQGDLVEPRLFTLKETQYAAGLFLRRNFNEHWALRLGGNYVKISGDDTNFDEYAARNSRFTNNFIDLVGALEWSPLSKENKEGKKRKIRPYLFGGVGYYIGDPEHTVGTPSTINPANKAKDVAELEKSSITVPFGAGFRFRLTDRVNLELEGSARATFMDYIDGLSLAGDSEDNDWYSMGGVNLVFSLGKVKDSDGDGITDKKDACPEVPGVVENAGCPADRDKDGVYDKDDKCPDMMGVAANMGCPADRDKDGVYDRDDKCPDVAGVAENMGCPSDRDKDGVVDADDKCPDVAGVAANKGCPADRDGDGVYDIDDKCPDVRGVAANKGCPADRDGDGIMDADDACPDLAGVAANKGCPTDRDKDGVYDKDDRCPDVAGLASNGGCPELKAEDKKVLDLAVKNINFETNKAVITKESYKILDQVADILSRYNYYSVAIEGHTDSQGNDASNLSLSKSRAQACYDYLVKKGIAASRMGHQGYGETRPVATNDTAEGRRQNRRVEFHLSVK